MRNRGWSAGRPRREQGNPYANPNNGDYHDY
jgi:hypothetical protein